MMRSLVTFLILASFSASSWSAEGMWTLDNPPLAAMKAELGWAPDQAWLDRAMHASARLENGCSSSFVSKSGLVLTNHHCAAECVENLSTPTHDLLKEGFLASTTSEERKCPAMEVSRLERMSDVTAVVTKAGEGLSGNAFTNAQNAAKARLTSECAAGDDHYRCDVVTLYHGGEYKLYRYRRFKDVRLVFVPEQAMAFFGGDPDNFNFPRYDLDMAILRVYDDGKPVAIADYFPFNAKGPAADEPVFVTGHPGSTQREQTVSQLATLRDQGLLNALLNLSEYRGVLEEYQTKGPEQARNANVELFSVENGYKAVNGELQALLDDRVFERKRADEAALRAYVAAHPELSGTAGAWDAIAKAQVLARDLYGPRAEIDQGRAFETTYFAFARILVRAAVERQKPNPERLPAYNDNRLPLLEAQLMSDAPIYPDFEKLKLTFSLTKFRERLGADSPLVKRVLGKSAPRQMATDLVDRTKLADIAYRRQLWDGGAAAVEASDDPFIRLAASIDPDARALRARYERDVESVVTASTEQIAKVRFAMLGNAIYPDATFTLRLSYGTVKGWDEAGQPVMPITTMGGAFERATGADPFALPASWLAKKTSIDPTTPFNFATTNDIIGGNSGSPVLNKRGELVGLVFDGNIHSLGGAFFYDPAQNRAVAVDTAAILEALDKIYDAKSLARELRGR